MEEVNPAWSVWWCTLFELRMEGLWVGGQAHQGVCVVGEARSFRVRDGTS